MLLGIALILPFCAIAMVVGPSDAELVERFKGGDRSAFNEIVQRYQHRVFTMCMRKMGNEQVASEVAQDVFVALFRALGRFRGDSQLSTWIYRVVINHCKNRRQYRRRRAMDRHESLDGLAENDDDKPKRQLPSDDAPPDASTFRSEAQAILEVALAELEEEQRTIIVLRDMEDLSYEEIGQLLELPRGTVKSRLHRARSQLAKTLSRHIKKEDVV